MKTNRGFTLFEILLSLTILSVLMMLAIPFYKDYSTRAKVSEGLVLASPFKTLVAEHYLASGNFPESGSDIGALTQHGNWVKSVQIIEGIIIIEYDSTKLAALGGNNIIVLTPSFERNMFTWDCKGGNIPDEYRPKNCKVNI